MVFDLRSDTVTRPTEAMRAAMATAEVGDDVYGEDPTVNRLEERAAAVLGKPAALFVPSGTMGNQICMAVLTRPGDEVIAEADAHLLINEVGSLARLWGCQVRPVPGTRGVMDPQAVAALVRGEDIHYPATAVLSLENTHNYSGGSPLPLDALDALTGLARSRGLAVHMDGARLFNAAVALQVPAARLVADVDLVSVCLSKGLGAPVGSVVAGSAEHIDRARKVRKALGGGMRQAGVIAAAALLALDEGPALLAEDHRRAQVLARGLAGCPGLSVDLDAVQTNIVVARAADAPALEAALARAGVLTVALDEARLRFVLHRDLDDAAVDGALAAVARALAAATA